MDIDFKQLQYELKDGGTARFFVVQDGVKKYVNVKIRKLTERECFRLMGVNDDDIDKIKNAGISKSQQYKMAGNSIATPCLYHIFRKMFIDKSEECLQPSLF